jgi:hypothetical protein
MNETVVIYGIVLGAAAFLALRWMPAGLRARVGMKPRSACATKSSCGSKSCGGCH